MSFGPKSSMVSNFDLASIGNRFVVIAIAFLVPINFDTKKYVKCQKNCNKEDLDFMLKEQRFHRYIYDFFSSIYFEIYVVSRKLLKVRNARVYCAIYCFLFSGKIYGFHQG